MGQEKDKASRLQAFNGYQVSVLANQARRAFGALSRR
jgi:hypothetical protein